MNSLIEVVTHPYLVLNRIAETLYRDKGNAIHQRLRSRVKGRHRFTMEEYQTLRRVLADMSGRFAYIASKLETAQQAPGMEAPDWRRLLQSRWINTSHLLEAVGARYGLNYLQVYDRLRTRPPLPEGFVPALIAEYRRFAAWIDTQLEQAKAERKDYGFSQGRGKLGDRSRKTGVGRREKKDKQQHT